MKNVLHFLFVLSMIALSACGSKKNTAATAVTTTTEQFCTGSYCYPTGNPSTNTNFINKSQLAAAIQAGAAFRAQSSQENHLFVEVTITSYDSGWRSWFNVSKTNYVGQENVATYTDGSILGDHPYGTSAADIRSKLITDVQNATGFQSHNNGMYSIQRSDGTILRLHTGLSISGNPIQIEHSNGTIFYRHQ